MKREDLHHTVPLTSFYYSPLIDLDFLPVEYVAIPLGGLLNPANK